MTSIGETLRRERQKRNLQLDQVSRELKISTRFLEAIEKEQFDRLPGGVFAKSFVRQYARMLDIDEEEAAAEVQRTLAPSSLPQFAEAAPNRAAPQTVEFAPRVDSISSRPFALRFLVARAGAGSCGDAWMLVGVWMVAARSPAGIGCAGPEGHSACGSASFKYAAAASGAIRQKPPNPVQEPPVAAPAVTEANGASG